MKFLAKNVFETGQKIAGNAESQGDQMIGKNNPHFGKNGQNNQQAKRGQNIYIPKLNVNAKNI